MRACLCSVNKCCRQSNTIDDIMHGWLVHTPPSYADIMELKRMMERLGQAKTHLELKKMIAEVDKNNSGVC